MNQNLAKKKGLRAAFIIINNIAKKCKTSTAIKIFERVVEPILTYNCEVTEAFFPDTWDYAKFQCNMWDSSHELNKVVLSFLRQILGVHKKTTNIALMAETGKYPLSIHVFSRIIKYYMRISISSKPLIKQAYAVNCKNFNEGKRNWTRMTRYITKSINFNETVTSSKEIDSKMKICKALLQKNFQQWWKSHAVVTGVNKLDFYYKYKKQFSFEKYLDNVPKALRMQITRLRLSSHPFPIETGRYSKKKVERNDRKCNICHLNEAGDEEHYLRRCANFILAKTRSNFIADIKEKCPSMANFELNTIMDYCILMSDPNIQLPMAIYTKELIESFSEIRNLQSKPPESPKVTRSGRLIKKPVKLDL